MTLERRWLITLAGLLALGVALEAAVGYGINWANAQYGVQVWLDNGKGAQAVLLERMFMQLETQARAFDPERVDPELHRVVVTAAGVKSALDDCAGAAIPPGPRAVIWCGKTPLMLVPVHGQPGLYLAAPLGEAFVDELKRLTLNEIELWGPHGLVATSLLLESGRRAERPALGLRERFERVTLGLGGGYGGYFTESAKGVLAEGASCRGQTHLDVFALQTPLEPSLGPADLRLVSMVPAGMMMFGPLVGGFAMTVLGFFIVAGLTVVARRLTREVSQPLRKLEQAAKAVALGDGEEFEVDDSGTYEVASLSTSVGALKARIEEQQRRAAQSEKMATIGALAGGVAHEINNPLGVILGFAQGMERRVPPGDALRLPVTSIVREALRCKALVQELLTFSRAGKKSDEDVDVNAAVESSVLLLGARAKTQGVELVVAVEPGLPALRGSRVQLQQVLVNLGTNALDAMKQGGTLTLRALCKSGDVVLEVADTGTGISAEVRPRIFEPFFTTKAAGEGTGLGLSIVYEIVQQHRGHIDVESSPEQGTLMRVTLPYGRRDVTPLGLPAVRSGAAA